MWLLQVCIGSLKHLPLPSSSMSSVLLFTGVPCNIVPPEPLNLYGGSTITTACLRLSEAAWTSQDVNCERRIIKLNTDSYEPAAPVQCKELMSQHASAARCRIPLRVQNTRVHLSRPWHSRPEPFHLRLFCSRTSCWTSACLLLPLSAQTGAQTLSFLHHHLLLHPGSGGGGGC